MRASRLVPSVAVLSTAALVGLLVAGCSSSPSAAAQSAGTSPAATGTAAGTATVSPLAAKLLTAGDLPAGWSVEVGATNPSMATSCPLLNTGAWNGSLPQRAEADLSVGMTGPFLVEQLAIGSAAQVDKAWQIFVAAIPKCTTFTHAGSSGASTYTVTRADFPSYGDESYGFGLDIKITNGVDASGNVVVARTGTAVVLVYLMGVPNVQQSLMEQIVAKAVAKA